jgi:hypothetical protein
LTWLPLRNEIAERVSNPTPSNVSSTSSDSTITSANPLAGKRRDMGKLVFKERMGVTPRYLHRNSVIDEDFFLQNI